MQLASGLRFSNVDSSLYYTDLALDYAVKLQLPLVRAGMLSLKGATVLESGRLPESLQFQFEALDIAQKLKDTATIAMAFNRIGNTYMELADYKKANEYYFRSKELFEVLSDSALIYNEISNIGNIYELMNLPDSALYYQQQVYKASKLRYNNRNFVTWPEMMFRMGNAYKLKGDKEKAMHYYKQGIIEANIDNDLRNLTANTLFLAKLYNDLNMPDSSLKYAYNALQTGNAVTFRKGVYDASVLISDLYKKRNQNDSAYKYLSIANQEKDNLTGIKRFLELQRIILDEQERQKTLEAERIESQNRQKQFILLGGLGIFLIVASILYFNNRQKQNANKILEATLTNLKSTQSQLIQSEKMASLGELTAGIAHEIQNPLNFVNNFSEVNTELIDELQKELKTGNTEEATAISNDIKDNEQKINHHGKRADAIVKGMLQHSRSSNGQKEPTDINALADEYLRLAYHGLRAKDKDFNATLVTKFDASIGKIDLIPQEIGRVILNLITNSFYAVAEKKKMVGEGYEPTVTVATKNSAGKIQISVADNGNGIPQKVLDKIFQPFFTTKPTGQGTGLGLSLSYDIIKAHGGELKVETKENEGSEFIIQLPFKSIV
ncbi:MAG: ATP-binding protein [Bacteroidetes bacterium]|nr:ATP-binding protein [Bacteroidota bacterium]